VVGWTGRRGGGSDGAEKVFVPVCPLLMEKAVTPLMSAVSLGLIPIQLTMAAISLPGVNPV